MTWFAGSRFFFFRNPCLSKEGAEEGRGRGRGREKKGGESKQRLVLTAREQKGVTDENQELQRIAKRSRKTCSRYPRARGYSLTYKPRSPWRSPRAKLLREFKARPAAQTSAGKQPWCWLWGSGWCCWLPEALGNYTLPLTLFASLKT